MAEVIEQPQAPLLFTEAAAVKVRHESVMGGMSAGEPLAGLSQVYLTFAEHLRQDLADRMAAGRPPDDATQAETHDQVHRA